MGRKERESHKLSHQRKGARNSAALLSEITLYVISTFSPDFLFRSQNRKLFYRQLFVLIRLSPRLECVVLTICLTQSTW